MPNYNKYQNIEFTLSSSTGESWIQKELNYWRSISDKLNVNGAEIPGKIKDSIKKYLAEIARAFNTPDARERLRITIEANKEHRLFNHDEDVAEAAQYISKANNSGLVTLIQCYRMSLESQDEAYTRLYGQDYENLKRRTSQGIADLIATLEQKIEVSRKELQDKVDTANKDLENIVAAATEAVALSEPVKFWETRQATHKENARKYGLQALTAAIIFGSLLTLTIIYEYISGRSVTVAGVDVTIPENNFGVAFLVLLTTAGIWSIRVFVKLMMANLAHETESLERATMIKTFVAMTKVNGEISKENQTLFFTTLFRPSNNSLSEDSTAPEFSRLIEAVLKSRGKEG